MLRKKLFLSSVLPFFALGLLQAQDPPQMLTNVKIYENDTIKSGFYLYKSSSLENINIYEGLQVVKKPKDRVLILRVDTPVPIDPEWKSRFFTLDPFWKLSAGFGKREFVGEKLFSVRILGDEFYDVPKGVRRIGNNGEFFLLAADARGLRNLLSDPRVVHIGNYREPVTETPVQFHDLSVNYINQAHYEFPDIRGSGLKASVKELLINNADLDLKFRFFYTGLEHDMVDQHSTVIATLIAGAGNSGETGLGVAPAAMITSSSFLNVLPDPLVSYQRNDISVQNHSYGTVPEYEYGNEAAAYDQNSNQLPHLVHVFSAGNSGLETPQDGQYKGMTGFANLTGNFKYAKNIITVGAINAEKQVLERSSKGPAPDGRVKPELVAFALAGTSDAAALVSGTALLVQNLYRELHQELPASALVKAALIAAAEDVGPPHVDYFSGYGSLDAAKSLRIIKEGQYRSGNYSEGDRQVIPINVPSGANQLRIALAWTDPAANPGDRKALINDLNLRVVSPSAQLYLPWTLDPDHLTERATRGVDSLNPVEVVSLADPEPGRYELIITAGDLQGEQPFHLAYTISRESSFEWTYPGPGDALQSNDTILRWKTSFEGSGSFQFRINGSPWKDMKVDQHLQDGMTSWDIPSESGTAQLRVLIGGTYFLSEEFVIAPEILPAVLYDCTEEAGISWNAIPGATSYSVSALGHQFMEIQATTVDTFFVIDKKKYPEKIWSVRPFFEKVPGPIGTAIDYTQQGVNCHYKGFYAFLDEEGNVTNSLQLSQSGFIQDISFERKSKNSWSSLAKFDPADSGIVDFIDTSVPAGFNQYRAALELKDGRTVYTSAVEIFLPGPKTFTVYPNPVGSGATVNILSLGDDLTFEVFDLQGRRVDQDILFRFSGRVELTPTAPGLYIVRALRNGEVVGISKLLVR